MDFHDRVKELVKTKSSLTLRAFIESFGINYDTYNGQKRLGNIPRADEAVKIAQALDTSVEFLVTGVTPGLPPHLKTTDIKLINEFNAASPEIQRAIILILENSPTK